MDQTQTGQLFLQLLKLINGNLLSGKADISSYL